MLTKTQAEKIRVLIIDDSRVVRIAAKKMFGDDFEVVLAVDGVDGWKTIQRDKDIQVVFTDLVMPVMDGFELLEKIRDSEVEAINSLPVIVATGADNPEIAKQKAIALGATDFITKPFDATDIQARAKSYAQFRQANHALKEQSTIDSVTGLLNSKGFYSQLEKDIAFIQRHKSPMALLSLEIDSFKSLFIRIGRAGAEAIIKKIGHVLTETVRKEDTVSRDGVAGFSIALPLANGDNALELANRICQKVESFRARLEGKKIAITVSIGVCAIGSGQARDADTALEAADAALVNAQALGRSQLFLLPLSEYLVEKNSDDSTPISIDELLYQISQGEKELVIPQLDNALDYLAPLLILLSNKQKQRIITYR